MLDGARLGTAPDLVQPQVDEAAVAGGGVAGDRGELDVHVDPQLLGELAPQGVGIGLPAFDLAAREFPLVGTVRPVLCGEHPISVDPGSRHDADLRC